MAASRTTRSPLTAITGLPRAIAQAFSSWRGSWRNEVRTGLPIARESGKHAASLRSAFELFAPPQLAASDLAGDGQGKVVDEFHLARIGVTADPRAHLLLELRDYCG